MSRRVLLLEDDPNLGLIVQEHLQLNGYEVTLCVDGESGLAEFGQGGFGLCLVDVMMPKLDGFAFAREIRKRDAEIPLIFLTARSLKEWRMSAGVVAWLGDLKHIREAAPFARTMARTGP